MTRAHHHAPLLGLLAALASASACAHGAASPSPLPDVVWPEAPAQPRLRLAAVFPEPGAPAAPRSRWRRLLDLVTGAGEAERDAETSLARPFGVAPLPGGGFVVADPDRPAVLRVVPGAPATAVACSGRAWAAPMAVAVAPDGAIWVADGAAHEIVRVGPDGACRAVGAGELERPTGVAVDGDRIAVADPPRHRIVVLSQEGALIGRWGELGDGDGRFHFPTAIARAQDGTFLVVDALNFRIVRLSASGEWLGSFGRPGDADGALARPKGVAVDDAGRIYVSDAQRDALLVYSQRGDFDCVLGARGGEVGRLDMPAGIALAGRTLYVADAQNRRVQTFEIVGGRP